MSNTNNLRALAMLLRTHAVAEHFDMRYLVANNERAEFSPENAEPELYNQCGTVACALGHGPLIFKAEPDESWHGYCERVFGIDFNNNDRSFNFLFSGEWEQVDNSPLGAAKRIEYFLKHGAPSSDDIDDMMSGDMELIYA